MLDIRLLRKLAFGFFVGVLMRGSATPPFGKIVTSLRRLLWEFFELPGFLTTSMRDLSRAVSLWALFSHNCGRFF